MSESAIERLERERDEARRERDEYHSRCEKLRADFVRLRKDRDGWEQLYVEARAEVRRITAELEKEQAKATPQWVTTERRPDGATEFRIPLNAAVDRDEPEP